MTVHPNPSRTTDDLTVARRPVAVATAHRHPNHRHPKRLAVFASTTAVSLGLCAVSPPVLAVDKLSEAEIFIELNDTDGDLGIHSKIDGDPWKKIEIKDPNGVEILEIRGKGKLGTHGVTELFFESAEPNFDDLSPEDFLKKFPEGKYKVVGTSINGDNLKRTTKFRHVIPAPAGNIRVNGVPTPTDCDDDKSIPKVKLPVTIKWNPVTQSHPTIGETGVIAINNYQLVVEQEEPQLLIFSVDLPPSNTKMRVSKQFLKPGMEYKMEVLAREKSYNQTAVETCFKTMK